MKKYYEALSFAAQLHDGQFRKGSKVPYLTHLMTVSSYVFEFGGSEDQAIAGLLHDAIEDQGNKTYLKELEKLFGSEVSRIVAACTDTEVEPKPPWEERKKAYLEKLGEKDSSIKLVVACDKFHNAQCIVRDVKLYGPDVWKRFNAEPARILWYYETLVVNLTDLNSVLIKLLDMEVKEIKKLIS